MLHPCSENGLVMLLRPLYLAPRCRGTLTAVFAAAAPGRERAYSTHGEDQLTARELVEVRKLKEIAVLGGGITGLASAYYVAKELPNARIVLYEASERLGGWVQSKKIDVGDGNVVFEQGPRTLRTTLPNGPVTMSLITQLGLRDKVIVTPRHSMASRNRYVYYPDHLVRLPTPPTSLWELLTTVFTEPLFKGIPMSIFREATRPKGQGKFDESIGSFFSRRFGPELVNNILSAMCHGIYAGDVWKLSAKSIFPFAWHGEETHGGVLRAMYKMWESEVENEAKTGSRGVVVQKADAEMILDLRDDMEKLGQQPRAHLWTKPGVYTLQGGLQSLTEALELDLRGNKNVEIRTNTRVGSVEPDPNTGGIRVCAPHSKTKAYLQFLFADGVLFPASSPRGMNTRYWGLTTMSSPPSLALVSTASLHPASSHPSP
ncbi:hypothetical protein GP486_006091 [Trichoglossum hirsutum]|uniref:Protoporphyrinogen oxidase n=1 Tax=Trichoglossum hirsutum TaxID=265104 RepID=A0A9P8RLI3_9PEZI|nr:hypothetical protein GP486_006091 [Trichoglossum hirsutum]